MHRSHLHFAALAAALLFGQPLTAQSVTPVTVRHLARHGDDTLLTAFAYDTVRSRVVMRRNDGTTWEADGSKWEYRSSGGAFGPMAYDPVRQRTVLVADGKTWEWDGFEWRQHSVQTTPAVMLGAALAYDSARDRMVLVTGNPVTRDPIETWEWDRRSWTRRTSTTTPNGGALSFFTLAYDTRRQVVVLYWVGGGGSRTWEWNGNDWSLGVTAGEPSNFQLTGSASYDRSRSVVVLASFDQLYEYDGRSWTKMPPKTLGGRVVYDSDRRETLLFPGAGTEIYSWDGRRLLRRAGPNTPPFSARDFSMVTDPARSELVAFGGEVRDINRGWYQFANTWRWDGQAWQTLSPPLSPPARARAGIAYDSSARRTILFGGEQWVWTQGFKPLDDTWAWDGQTWTRLQPRTKPPAGPSTALCWDEHRARAILFTSGQTWEWTGSDWLQRLTNSAPSRRSGHAMAYDPGGRRTLLFGGTTGSAETWSLDGQGWTRLSPQTVPPGRHGHRMAFDPIRKRVLLHGGQSGTGPLGDAWEWTGSDWRSVPTTSPLPAGGQHGMAFDPTRRVMLIHTAQATTLLATHAAEATGSGQGCGASSGTLTIGASTPRIGNQAFQLELRNARPNAAAVFAASENRVSIPLGRCRIHVGAPTFTLATRTTSHGFGRLPLAIPFDPSLRGVVLYVQGFAADPAGPFGLALSGAIKLRIGD